MGTRERREREREALRGEILAAARELFISEGYERVSMRRIAERIEYSPTTIYLYFRDKSEILDEICEQTFARLAKSLERIEGKGLDPLEGLREGCQAYIQFGLRNRHQYRLTFMVSSERMDRHDESGYEGSMGERAFGFLERAVARCAEAGYVREVEVAVASQVVWVTIHGLTSLLITLDSEDFPWVEKKRLIGETIETVIRGLKK
ncbi:MAG: TetR/AcrR family transcriptional regulator [Blastocatellia bacterium]|jgi:AcrR family transcriptional regulator